MFGLATLIFNGLEIAMNATMNDKAICLFYSVWSGNTDLQRAGDSDARHNERQCNMPFFSVWFGNTDLQRAGDCYARHNERQCNMPFFTVFGLATLIFVRLEIVMHAPMNNNAI
jgi:hypothetical protein